MARAKIRGIYEKTKGSGIWWIRWTDADHKKRREKAGRYSDAGILLAKRKTEKLQGLKLPEILHKKSLLLSNLIADAVTYSKASNCQRSTQELELKFGRIEAEFGTRQADSIAKHEIIAWLQKEAENHRWKPGTVNRYQAAFSLIFRVALDNNKLTVNPAARIRRKREDNGRVRFLSPEEERKIVKVLREQYPLYVPSFLISIHCGMRASEQWRTEWGDVDFDAGILTVGQTKSVSTGPSHRHVPMNAVARNCFRQLLKARKAGKHVFLNTKGEKLSGHRDWFDPALKKSGVKDYHWHDNRHTFCSRLVMAGVDLRTIASLAGHATIQMTMRYAHLSPDHNKTAVEKLVQYSRKRSDTKSDTNTRKSKNWRISV